MKKNRCPPEATGCGGNNIHMDVAAPGYDNKDYSLSNVCAKKPGTGFTRQADSFVCGDWYKYYPSTQGCKGQCSKLPSRLQSGCNLFSRWGWKTGNPIMKYRVVDCPPRFKNYISRQFDRNGPN